VLPTEPLTGRLLGELSAVEVARPAVAAKIDNSPTARPQAGLNDADVLYEIMIEARFSRFLAVFHSVDDTLIGPLRSGRESDLDVLRGLGQPLFVISGANGYTLGRIGESDGDDWVLASKSAQFREEGRHGLSWQNLMATLGGVRLADAGKGGAPTPLFGYSDVTLRNGKASAGAEVAFGEVTSAYEWDGATYLRSSDGEPHFDSNGGRVSADNVVVQFVDYEFRAATGSPVARTVGRGAVWMLRDGRLVEGRWRRDSASGATVYTDAAGDTVELRPGRTHVLLAPPGSARRT